MSFKIVICPARRATIMYDMGIRLQFCWCCRLCGKRGRWEDCYLPLSGGEAFFVGMRIPETKAPPVSKNKKRNRRRTGSNGLRFYAGTADPADIKVRTRSGCRGPWPWLPWLRCSGISARSRAPGRSCRRPGGSARLPVSTRKARCPRRV